MGFSIWLKEIKCNYERMEEGKEIEYRLLDLLLFFGYSNLAFFMSILELLL